MAGKNSKNYEIAYKLAAKLDKKYNQAFEKAESIASKTAKNIKKVMLTAVAGIGATAFIASSTNDFINFEQSMREVFTLLPGISREAMDDMSEQVKKASLDMGVLPEETVPALYQALSAGVPKDNVFDFLNKANMAATGGVTSLETAVDGLTTVVNSYGSDVIDAGKASDLMFTAVKAGKTTFEELSNSLYNVLPTASASGVAFEDITAALATMTSQGVPTASATNKISKSIQELSDKSTAVGKKFDKVSGKSFKQFIAEGGNMQGALQLLEKYANDTGVGVNELFSSVEAGSAAIALTGKGTEKFSSSLKEMENSLGATEAAFNTMEESFADVLEDLKVKFAVMKLTVGKFGAIVLTNVIGAFEKLGSVISTSVNGAIDKNSNKIWTLQYQFNLLRNKLNDLTGTITGSFGVSLEDIADVTITKVIDVLSFLINKASDVVNFFSSNWSKISIKVNKTGNIFLEFGKSVLNLASTIYERLKPAIIVIGSAVASAVPIAIDIFTGFLSIVTKIINFVADNWSIFEKIIICLTPFGPIVMGIVKVLGEFLPKLIELGALEGVIVGVVGAFLAFKSIMSVMNTFKKVSDTTKNISKGFKLLKAAMSPTMITVGLVAIAIGALIVIGVLLYKNWDKITAKATELKDSFINVVDNLSEKFPIIGDVISTVTGYISAQIANVKLIFSGIIDFVVGVFTGDWERAWTGIKNIFSGIFGGMVENVKLPISIILSVFNNLIDKISERFPMIGAIISTVTGYISAQIANIKLIFTGVIDFITGVFTGDWEKAWIGITSIFDGIFGGIAEMAKLPINTIITMINGLIDKINGISFDVPSWVPMLGGETVGVTIPKIPMFAKGTESSPSTFIAGEKGAELITNRPNSKIFTALETGNILQNLAKLSKIISKGNDDGDNDDGYDGDDNNNNFDRFKFGKGNNGNVGNNGGNGNDGITLHYSPTISISGNNSDNEEIKTLIESLLAKDKLELVKLIKDILRQEKERNMRLSNA